METLKYKNAPDAMYCDGDGCRWNTQGNCHIYEHVLKPCNAGYVTDTRWPNGGTPSGSDSPGNACWAGQKLRVCRKNPHDSYWDPLPTAMEAERQTTGKFSEANLEKAQRCCFGSLYTIPQKEECGNFLGTADTQPSECDAVMSEWCKIGDNILHEKCYKLVKANPGQFSLRERCAKQIPGGDWDTLCACYYPAKFYTDIVEKAKDKWNMPPEYAVPLPQCVYPNCKLSPLNPDPESKNCKGVSFSSCIQNMNIDASGSVIGGNIIPEMKSQCEGTFTAKTNSGTTVAKTPEEIRQMQAQNDEAHRLKLAQEQADAKKKKQMMFVAVIFIVAVIFMLKRKSATVTKDVNSVTKDVTNTPVKYSMLNSY